VRAFLKLLILGPVAIVVMALAVVNNQPVRLVFDPFTPEAPLLSLTAPLYAVFFVALLAGVLIGGFGAWSSQGRVRRAARASRREAEEWKGEAGRLKEQAAALSEAGGTPRPLSITGK
jgi:uncharacterized integral membrane protein